ncbi:MAG TPA: hypothetical protein VFZ58_00830 [Candidatus Saccharimonadales bacterium]
MNRARKLISAGALGIALAGTSLVVAIPAQAAEYNSTSWRGYLANPNNAGGWKCANRAYPYQSGYSVNVQKYCTNVYGLNAYYGNWYNPYSWYCA